MNLLGLKPKVSSKGSDFPLLYEIPAALRIGNVVLDCFSRDIADGAEKFSRAPKVTFAKMVSQARVLF